ncbi:hypothetical protein FDECE_6064 [Fusarium decemcellulare]|nr:hypothetical protein FDECE_6064 [Fusarium decemcellulare]
MRQAIAYLLSACSAVFAQDTALFDAYDSARCAGANIIETSVVKAGDCLHTSTAFASAQFRGRQFDNVEQPVVFFSDELCQNEITDVAVETGDGFNCFTLTKQEAKGAKWVV